MSTNPKQFLIEGVDRMGKSTLIQGLLDKLGYHLVVHYDKPKKLQVYLEEDEQLALYCYQHALYTDMFDLIAADHHLIFDRAHLGEMVYAPMYRKYSGEYVLDMEREHAKNTTNARLVLLTTSDFSFIKDDGQSFDFSKKEAEQEKFVAAFARSQIKDKVFVDVSNKRGGYKSPAEILNEVLNK
jgi:thymidylate kinase